MSLYWSWVSVAFLMASLSSFSWGMQKFFYKPSGDSSGMRVIRLCGTLFGFLHLTAILATPDAVGRRALAAALLYAVSIGLFYWAIRANGQRSLSAAFSPDAPAHLVDWGPYGWVRHPFYCSYLLTWIAGYVATGRWWLLPTVAVMIFVYDRAAKMEEAKFAASSLRGEYARYCAVTGRFFPSIAALLGKGRRRASDEASLA